ncbi:PREDICTED: DDT domain-containing protein PTM-like [Nelumbo nucifera]|uniref:DDT domain-containing protein PTM-like n=2 Tax=Nelumbo nucifera TaxID=4432 RepID=A0A1U8BAJ4_NELNU|nr:PREDICTED: DDT domain-containing protein PTM-like [Nelumbo nucifera]DAD28691.1 TPA_asm: hypothetical protein HUJ06_030159 [Nelumbo nucifera]
MMESEEVVSEDRVRKRIKMGIGDEGVDRTEGLDSRGRVETTAKALVGRYVMKEFAANGVFLGKLVSCGSGLYRVDYENGDFEDMECTELRDFLLAEGDFDEELIARKVKLDKLISTCDSKTPHEKIQHQTVVSANSFERSEAPCVSRLSTELESCFQKGPESGGVQVDGDADSSTDSCEYIRIQESLLEAESPLLPPPPPLPPSSGNIGVPQEFVSQLFSVYNFLRSFSIQLFLSPFGLDDFVGSLNCAAPNTLLDAIHVALMRALKRHLQMLSSDGAELASKCLRRLDWSLLDTLTWPVYLVEFLLVMGYTNGPDWKGFCTDVLNKEYYILSASRKLMILQILCDDIIESAELRTEIDMREKVEVGTDSDRNARMSAENCPRRVHPRYSKTSACKDSEAMEIVSDKSHDSKSPCQSSSLLKVPGVDMNVVDVDPDENSDECRLCGMDGTLICCDGCPSAYHSRCIGLSKIHLPEGSWFCPECAINKIGPNFRIGTGLKQAEFFGIDPYEQVFLGTCNHLLVLKVSIHEGPSCRYYNQNDVPKVLQVLCSSVEHTVMYSAICKGILKYWGFPEDTKFSFPERRENTIDEREDAMVSALSYNLSGKDNASGVTESNMEDKTLLGRENDWQELCYVSLDKISHVELPSLSKGNGATTEQVSEVINTKLHDQFGADSLMSAGSICLQADPSDLPYQISADKSIMLKFPTCTSENMQGSKKEDADVISLPAINGPFSMSYESKEVKHSGNGRSKAVVVDDCSYMGYTFKPQAYVNLYILGDVAASAAANLAVLSSDENNISGSQSSINPRKLVSANVSLQIKAFSSAVFHFFWPNSEKKLMEIPRERCGWCLSCKAPITSKKGCLLNLTASNAIKGPMKILGGLRSLKSAEGNIHCIATYILCMEQSLRGLTIGPFLTSSYRKQWRKQVEQASTCTALKSLLLELEENIRPLAFTGGWVKLVDDWSVEFSVSQSASHHVGPTQKRGPGGRRSRKQSMTSEITSYTCQDNLRDVNWWRGGKLSKFIFQKGILPCSVVKKAARQGGSRKISGIYYAEGFDIPKRSRRFAWRAAVEMSNNASQLALQVRYLDLHIRWSDLLRPEQKLQDGKGPETEISAFRNAVICDKKIQHTKIRYGVVFANQKHLPSRVLKNILESEQIQDGEDKFWFCETHIPLYLIKEYEGTAEKVSVPSAKGSHLLSNLQRIQLKASRKDIFSYLLCKVEKLDKCACASCQQDVLLGNAVKCSSCQGFCHKECTITSKVHMNDTLEFLITCNQCYCAKIVTVNEISKKSPISQVPFQEQKRQNVEAVVGKGSFQNGHLQSLFSGNMGIPQETKPPTLKSNLETRGRRVTGPSYGLIWRKNNEETGEDFRLRNILFKGNADTDLSIRPICHLCRKPYDHDLMYICCETCRRWYHADALQLEESKILEVVGFRCCRCRRNRLPICPYMDPECRRKRCVRASKRSSTGTDSISRTICTQLEGQEISTPDTKMEDAVIEDDDSLVFSLERVVPITEPASEIGDESYTTGSQKLPVKRHIKNEINSDVSDLNSVPSQVVSTLETNNLLSATERASSPQVGWKFPTDGVKDEIIDMIDYESLNYEDMEFESTYFTLASEDNGLDPFDASMDISGNWGNSSFSGAIASYNPPEQYGIDTAEGNQDFTKSSEPIVSRMLCKICSSTEPAPDLSCEICGIWIHCHCSPWDESSSGADRWRCGYCRDWR